MVDEVNAGFEGVERILLARRLRLSLPNELDGWIGEENSAMTVSLEVDTNIESLRGMVEMLDAGRSADNRKLEHLLYIFGRSAVGVGSLDETNPQLFAKTCIPSHFCKEDSTKGCNAVAIKQMEDFVLIKVVENNAVSIAIERAAPVERGSM